MIHNLRTTHARHISVDRAIVDLLELQELDLAPGMLTTSGLQELWGCSQSQVSRRLAAIDRLTHWSVQGWQGGREGFWLAPRLAPAPVLPEPAQRPRRQHPRERPSPRERWEALRSQWREVVA